MDLSIEDDTFQTNNTKDFMYSSVTSVRLRNKGYKIQKDYNYKGLQMV